MPNPLSAPIRVEAYDDGRRWKILHTVIYVARDGRRILIPEGTITDFASIPRCLWWLMPPLGRYLYAALVHDQLYFMHNTNVNRAYSRAYADGVMLDAMRASSVIWWMRWMIYLGVRIGGWQYWRGSIPQGGATP